jgi:hypothetical protein
MQGVLPLNTKIAYMGNAKLEKEQTYELGLYDSKNRQLTTEYECDDFAPAQFRHVDDDKKLTAPSFEKLPAGLELERTDIFFDASKGTLVDIDYDTFVILDKEQPAVKIEAQKQQEGTLDAAVQKGASARASAQRKGPHKYRGPGLGLIQKQPKFSLVTADELAAPEEAKGVLEKVKFDSYTAAQDAIDDLLKRLPGNRLNVKIAPSHLVEKD